MHRLCKQAASAFLESQDLMAPPTVAPANMLRSFNAISGQTSKQFHPTSALFLRYNTDTCRPALPSPRRTICVVSKIVQDVYNALLSATVMCTCQQQACEQAIQYSLPCSKLLLVLFMQRKACEYYSMHSSVYCPHQLCLALSCCFCLPCSCS